MRVIVFTFICILTIKGVEICRAAEARPSYVDQMTAAQQFIEKSLLELRANPLLIIESADANETHDTNTTVALKLEDIFPLLENTLLGDSAQRLCESALSGGINTVDSNSTRTVLEKLGYDSFGLHVKTSGLIMREYMDPMEAAGLLLESFRNMLLKNLLKGDETAFLSNFYHEMGVGYCGGTYRLTESEEANIYMMVLVLARPRGPQPYWIQCGHVFFDLNNNSSYDEGEGLNGVQMEDGNGTLLSSTLSSGQYCFRRPQGNWTLYLENFPFVQNYITYSSLLDHREQGILKQDYPLLLTQEVINLNRALETENAEK